MTGREAQGAGLSKTGAVVVAHPDDETIWAGGLLLTHPWLDWTIVSLCRASDADRAPRFAEAVRRLGAQGGMTDLDDSPAQAPLPEEVVAQAVAGLLTAPHYDWVVTHSPNGEYTRHRRHEEVGRAVLGLWACGKLSAGSIWLFAYGDAGPGTTPRPLHNANRVLKLSGGIYREKVSILADVYGFAPASFEVQAANSEEAFWVLPKAVAAIHWIKG